MSDSLDLGAVDQSGYVDVAQRTQAALTCFELGVTRCAVVEHDGLWGGGWDTHAGIDAQSNHFEVLFTDLLAIFEDMASRAGTGGGSLLDEVTVVVLSEMGRTPRKNLLGGKDHWTFTSALLYGNGIAGGQVVGGYDENFLGSPTDLSSGETNESGIVLNASNLGATLLALGDVDPGEYLGDVDIIEAVID